MNLKDKVAIVTGASQGIGKEIALFLACQGVSVVLVARNKTNLERVLKEIHNEGRQALSIPTDISSREQVRNMIRKTINQFGGIDILINNAGVTWFGRAVDDMSESADELFERLVATNLKGTWFCTKYAIPYLKKRNDGVIINIASVHGHATVPKSSAYSMIKGGILTLTRALAVELAPYNIRVNSISPGWIQTQRGIEVKHRFGEEVAKKYLEAFSEYEDNKLKLNQPLRQVGKPKDVAQCVLFLASENSRFITGADIAVDGGLTSLLAEPLRFNLDELLQIKKEGKKARSWLNKFEKSNL